MFMLFLGIILFIFAVIQCLGIYDSLNATLPNGEIIVLTEEEMSSVIIEIIIFGGMLIISIALIIGGICAFIRTVKFYFCGQISQAMIVDKSLNSTGGSKAKKYKITAVCLMPEGKSKEIVAFLKFCSTDIKYGDYVLMKHYKKNAKFIKKISERDIPYVNRERFEIIRENMRGTNLFSRGTFRDRFVNIETKEIFNDAYIEKMEEKDLRRIDDNTVYINGVEFKKIKC